MVYTITGTGGPVPCKLRLTPAKGQATWERTKGERHHRLCWRFTSDGKLMNGAHVWRANLGWGGAAGAAKGWLPLSPGGGKLSPNTWLHSGATDSKHAESRNTWCSVKDDFLAISHMVLVWFNVTFTLQARALFLTSLFCNHPNIQVFFLKHIYNIKFCPNLYFKELFASPPQIYYENYGGTDMYSVLKQPSWRYNAWMWRWLRGWNLRTRWACGHGKSGTCWRKMW